MYRITFQRSLGVICLEWLGMEPWPRMGTWYMRPSVQSLTFWVIRLGGLGNRVATRPSPAAWGPWQAMQMFSNRNLPLASTLGVAWSGLFCVAACSACFWGYGYGCSFMATAPGGGAIRPVGLSPSRSARWGLSLGWSPMLMKLNSRWGSSPAGRPYSQPEASRHRAGRASRAETLMLRGIADLLLVYQVHALGPQRLHEGQRLLFVELGISG